MRTLIDWNEMLGTKEKTLIEQIESDALDENASLSTALRKCIILGGESGSASLRDWATQELKGYYGQDDVPEYRVVTAPLLVDAFVGNGQITGQPIPATSIPTFAREAISESVRLAGGVGELEGMLGREKLILMPEHATDVVAVMNDESDVPFQQIIQLYWKLSPAVIHGVLDQIRTSLTQLVAELRAEMKNGEEIPSSAAADQAVSVVVTGKRAKVNVATATTSGPNSPASASANTRVSTADDGFWTRTRVIGGFIAGLAGVIAATVAVMQYV